jgi:hypothetical protein
MRCNSAFGHMLGAIVRPIGNKNHMQLWTSDGAALGNYCIWYSSGDTKLCGTETVPSVDIDLQYNGDIYVWYFGRTDGDVDCSALTVSECAATGHMTEVGSVSTSTPGYQLSSTITYSATSVATTSTSSPPSYHNVISADGVVLGGLILVVITLLLWKQSSAR